jgi:hypothetical protein
MKQFFSKILSPMTLAVFTAQIIVGGILLPRQQALAFLEGDYIGGPANVAGWAAEKVADEYESAASWISALANQKDWLNTVLNKAMTAAWQTLKKQLMNMMVDDIVNWINGGGEPRFVSDWGSFLSDAADQAGGQFIDQLSLGFLCENLAPTIKIALSSSRAFSQTAKCTLSDAGKNLNNFFEDFSNGGWDRWMQLTQPQNNIFGAYYMALDAKWLAELSASESAKNEALASGGFLSDKVCKEMFCPGQETDYSGAYTSGTWTKDEISADTNLSNNCSCTKWETRTPGKTIADTLSKAIGSDIDWLTGADEWGEYLGVIVDAAFNRVFREGMTMLKDTGSAGQTGIGITIPASDSNISSSAYQDATVNKPLAEALNEQILLLQENKEKLASDYQISLSVLNDIQTAQINGFTALKDILAEPNCSLPSGVSSSVLNSQSLSSCPPLSAVCGCAQDTLGVSATNIGEAEIERTLARTRGCNDYDDGFASIISSSPAIAPTINQMNSQIADEQTQITKVASASAALNEYINKAAEYIAAYDDWIDGLGTQTAANLAETAMWTAKTAVLSSLQSLFGVTTSNLQELAQKAQEMSQQTLQGYGDSQIKRGVSGYCGYDTGDTHYQYLCNVQSAVSSFQSTLSACLAAQERL